MTLDLDLLERLAKAATSGERKALVHNKEIWATNSSGFSERISTWFYPTSKAYKVDGQELARPPKDAINDANFYEAANPAVVLELIERVRRLEKAHVDILRLSNGPVSYKGFCDEVCIVARAALSETEGESDC